MALSSLEKMYENYCQYFKDYRHISKPDPDIIVKLQESYVTIWEKYRLSHPNVYWTVEKSKLLEYMHKESFLGKAKPSACVVAMKNMMEGDRLSNNQPVKPGLSPRQ